MSSSSLSETAGMPTLVPDVIRQAADEVARLCAGRGRMSRGDLAGRDWTMCIPVQHDDSDIIFTNLIEAAAKWERENAELRAALAASRSEGQQDRELPPFIVSRIVRALERSLEIEAWMFKPGRMHHNGPRRIAPELNVQDATLLRDHLSRRAARTAVAQPETEA